MRKISESGKVQEHVEGRVHIHWTQFTESGAEAGAAALMASHHSPKELCPSMAGEQLSKLLRLTIDYQDLPKMTSLESPQKKPGKKSYWKGRGRMEEDSGDTAKICHNPKEKR